MLFQTEIRQALLPESSRTAGPVSPTERAACAFSPDGRTFAYLWRETTVRQPTAVGAAPAVMHEALSVRWLAVDDPSRTESLVLDEIDLAPDGVLGWHLEGRLRFSPDSTRLLAVCARTLLAIDLSGAYYQFLPGEELFCDATWLPDGRVVYVKTDGRSITFHRLRFDADPMVLSRFHRERLMAGGPAETTPMDSLLPVLVGRFDFAPDGRSVLFRSQARQDRREVLLDLETGDVHPLLASVYSFSWGPDGAEILVAGNAVDDDDEPVDRVLHVDARTGRSQDITAAYREAGCEDFRIRFDAPTWAASDRLVVHVSQAIEDEHGREDVQHRTDLVALRPWRIVLTRPEAFHQSPRTGWLLAERDGGLIWLSEDGPEAGTPGGGAADWVWSPTGTAAAIVTDDRVEIVTPEPPTGAP